MDCIGLPIPLYNLVCVVLFLKILKLQSTQKDKMRVDICEDRLLFENDSLYVYWQIIRLTVLTPEIDYE